MSCGYLASLLVVPQYGNQGKSTVPFNFTVGPPRVEIECKPKYIVTSEAVCPNKEAILNASGHIDCVDVEWRIRIDSTGGACFNVAAGSCPTPAPTAEGSSVKVYAGPNPGTITVDMGYNGDWYDYVTLNAISPPSYKPCPPWPKTEKDWCICRCLNCPLENLPFVECPDDKFNGCSVPLGSPTPTSISDESFCEEATVGGHTSCNDALKCNDAREVRNTLNDWLAVMKEDGDLPECMKNAVRHAVGYCVLKKYLGAEYAQFFMNYHEQREQEDCEDFIRDMVNNDIALSIADDDCQDWQDFLDCLEDPYCFDYSDEDEIDVMIKCCWESAKEAIENGDILLKNFQCVSCEN